jgi:ankyrin repeat protein
MSRNFDKFCDHAANGRLILVRRMLEYAGLSSGSIVLNEDDALVRAAENGRVDVVDYLIERRRMFDRSANESHALRLAAENGHVDVVERLLQERVDPTSDNNAAVRWAAANGHFAVVDLLMQDARVDPSAEDNFAVQMAAGYGHFAVVDRLLEDDRVDPSTNNNFAFQMAAGQGHLAIVDRLLEDDRVDAAVATQHSRPEHRKRFECRERLTEICIALQDLALPAWVTVQILDAARPWSTLPLHSKWNLVCAVKHFHEKQ